MISPRQIQKAKDVLMKYLMSDALKPEYDGMTAYELARLVLEASEYEAQEEDGEKRVKEAQEEFNCPNCGLNCSFNSRECDNCSYCQTDVPERLDDFRVREEDLVK